MSNAACDLAEALGATAIVVPTYTGRTASAVARLRPRRPIVGLSHHQYALQQMALEWGVTPLGIPESADVEDLWDVSLGAARDGGLVREGDRVVITGGHGGEHPGLDERDQGRGRLRTPGRRSEPGGERVGEPRLGEVSHPGDISVGPDQHGGRRRDRAE